MLRPYTDIEMEAIEEVVREATVHANKAANALADVEEFRDEWNALFHGYVHERLIELEIHKPRAFFESNALRLFGDEF